MLVYQYHNQPLVGTFVVLRAAIIRLLKYNFFLNQ